MMIKKSTTEGAIVDVKNASEAIESTEEKELEDGNKSIDMEANKDEQTEEDRE